MDVILHLAVTAMLVMGTVWKAADLIRAPHDRLLRLLVLCLLLLTAGDVLGFPEVRERMLAFTPAGVGKVVFNALYMSGLSMLILFFVASTRGAPAVFRRQLRLHTGLLVGVLAALVISMIGTPPALRDHTLSSPHIGQPGIACFYLAGNLFFIYAYVVSGLWALRHARRASRHLARGLRTMTAGLFGLALTAAGRVVLVLLRTDVPGSHPEMETVNLVITDLALACVLIGIVLFAGVQLATHLRSVLSHRRMHDQLAPLWQALVTAYPELVLTREPVRPRWQRLRLRHTHARFYRRLIECRDGLVRLSPYLALAAPDTDLARCGPDQLARHITRALALRPEREDPHTALPAVWVALPTGNDVSAEARILIALSAALDRAGHGHGHGRRPERRRCGIRASRIAGVPLRRP
ncbi:MAB_1171c family putative transporter [Streptomyces sp. BK79]|uniref:MAB_1171c family putative transporter n=1 Tax=Streptomyces sp. BK79 TaxID=3350097 RepID=UPI00376F4964